ncbi:MAG: tRNA uridine-5-carboxymethylaminomethyl(34) synthesis GTPase MnmE [candidate division Zixibacteria bacterium]|nr:tRNA uridine-5-carboxymethylaminomethyl(34) synthesis GTPase MnmE [candidate division Zixibacteria bacterium]
MASSDGQVMDDRDDTIVAIITPPGEGGVAGIRLAGPLSLTILDTVFRPESSSSLKPFVLRYGRFVNSHGESLDEVMAVYMPQGKSYTGLDQVEFFCHGGRQVVRLLLEVLLATGARAAQPGEFTRLAFLNGRIDLTQAEAVAEVIAANTEASWRAGRDHLMGGYAAHVERIRQQLVAVLAEIEASIDFTEEDIDPARDGQLLGTLETVERDLSELLASYTGGRIIKEGFTVAIAGRPNSGKSSLFNLLLKQERALVNPEPGTTRDYLSEWLDIDGFAVKIVDTAGLRADGGTVEKAGQARAEEIIDQADLVLWLADMSEKAWPQGLQADIESRKTESMMLVGNKLDVVNELPSNILTTPLPVHFLSCKTGEGCRRLTKAIAERIKASVPDLTSGHVVTSARHKQNIELAAGAVVQSKKLMAGSETPDIIAFELRRGADALAEITGKIYTEQILGTIFSRFCVGK